VRRKSDPGPKLNCQAAENVYGGHATWLVSRSGRRLLQRQWGRRRHGSHRNHG